MTQKHVVILGGGFAGINLAKKLVKEPSLLVTLVDKNNYNFFPPLLYQVATGFLEVSNISFPFRKLFQDKKNFRFRLAECKEVVQSENRIILSNGDLQYDYLVIATGTEGNYFGIENIEKNALPMKTVSDAINLRNYLLKNIEDSTLVTDAAETKKFTTLVIVGGGPTGVELAGMLAEMTKHILKKDYPELADRRGEIILIDSNDRVLSPMSEASQRYTYETLQQMGVTIKLNTRVKDYVDGVLYFTAGDPVPTKTLIWAAGVTVKHFNGIGHESYGKGNRLIADAFHTIKNTANIFAIGDISIQTNDVHFPNGHPQVAQVAMQQGKNLAKNMIAAIHGKPLIPFAYTDKGSMAIIGSMNAVAELPKPKMFFKGFIALCMWLFIHLTSLINHRNRSKTFYNWLVAYLTKDQSLRFIIRPEMKG